MPTQLNPLTNQSYNPFAQHVASRVCTSLGTPSVTVSDWQIVADESLTVSGGPDIVSASVSQFSLTVSNRRTGQALAVNGYGGGGGVGLSALPVDASGSPPTSLPTIVVAPGQDNRSVARIGAINLTVGEVAAAINGVGALIAMLRLPGWNSPLFLCPGHSDSAGAHLFSGGAVIVGAAIGLGVEFGDAMMIFYDFPTTPGGPAAAKAFTFATGFDYLTNASVGVSDLTYFVTATPANYCAVITV